MSRIAKKPRNVKRAKGVKKPPRYTIRKDSLGRRYAIDKRDGKRVSLSKANAERERRRKAASKAPKVFHGIKPPKPPKAPKAKTSKQKRSEAAKKGWETRRQREKPPISERSIQRVRREVETFAIPEGMRMHILNGIADRADHYPKVKTVADEAFDHLMLEHYARRIAMHEHRPLPVTLTPRFDKKFGIGRGQLIRDHLAGARDLQDIDQIAEEMGENPDFEDVPLREIYTLYFSPELA